ncbi:selenoneine biosynthesis selenosugar synthase SenB [Sulfurisoma sediminicola]|uniref:Putative glycosyltransferase (TIGR04348 family) n=1 Tax=Sulfurisoma sediminicola TaxID=1381557 RepID=A0A497XDM0_9PROT|nr:selenoneine biosynthesis selenosugar synthase SenB [Sulfurisoma sediminicola]RLJ65112.1 putative glycosyltransferase (TIGR04348 family) [Sulfurisoma sediminicola]
MSPLHCVIVTPAPPGSRAGNRNTAVRWARILRGLGLRVDIATEWRDGDHDLMIALHARRSRTAMLHWRQRCPHRPLILALTGTDLYRDIRSDAGAADSLELADRLVVLQACGLDELTPAQRAKARVILQSETARGVWAPPRRFMRFAAIGHLREEKDPLRAAHALGLLRALAAVRVVQVGAALVPAWAQEAQALIQREPRYRWRGEVPHWQALKLLRQSHALVISSLMEGGAHVVSEAIVHGVPVLASDIPGNVGLLGADYAGYFRVGDTAALAALMRRAHEEPAFLRTLHKAVVARQPLFTPEREVAAWRATIADFYPRPK